MQSHDMTLVVFFEQTIKPIASNTRAPRFMDNQFDRTQTSPERTKVSQLKQVIVKTFKWINLTVYNGLVNITK